MAGGSGSSDSTIGYLKVTDVTGESTDRNYVGWVKVTRWNWAGMSGSTVGQTTGSSGAGKVSHGPLVVTVYLDSAGPEFWDMLNKGQHKSNLMLSIPRLGQDKKTLQLQMQEVYCSSYALAHNSKNSLPEAEVSFTWGSASLEYFKQDDEGITNSTGKKSYDARTNTPTG